MDTPTPTKNRHRLARLTLAASVLGGGALGAAVTVAGAGAQDTSTTVVSEESTAADHSAWADDVFAQLVSDGTLTQEQADATKAALQAARPEHPGGGRHGERRENVEELAASLGVDVEELATQLRDGTTIAEIADANGVDVQTVIDDMVADATARINERVASGDMTQERADEILAELPDKVTERVNNGRPEGRPGFGHGPHRGGPADDSAPADSAPADSDG